MVHFRKRLDSKVIADLNEALYAGKKSTENQDNYDQNNQPPNLGCLVDGSNEDEPSSDQTTQQNNGKLILDATYTPAKVKYPTDLSLLNEAREELEAMVDSLHENQKGQDKSRERTV